jgi:hypothetical protein
MSNSIQWWKPGHVHQQAAMRFADLWDELFGKVETFMRVEYDGSWLICELRDCWEYHNTGPDGERYTITTVRMTRRQFNNLPEFEGF